MEQARVQEETQMKMDHARRLKQMRLSLEDEKRKRIEENARLRRQLELKQVNFFGECLMQPPGPLCMTSLVLMCSAVCQIRCSLVHTSCTNNSCQLSLQQIYRHVALRQSCETTSHTAAVGHAHACKITHLHCCTGHAHHEICCISCLHCRG